MALEETGLNAVVGITAEQTAEFSETLVTIHAAGQLATVKSDRIWYDPETYTAEELALPISTESANLFKKFFGYQFDPEFRGMPKRDALVVINGILSAIAKYSPAEEENLDLFLSRVGNETAHKIVHSQPWRTTSVELYGSSDQNYSIGNRQYRAKGYFLKAIKEQGQTPETALSEILDRAPARRGTRPLAAVSSAPVSKSKDIKVPAEPDPPTVQVPAKPKSAPTKRSRPKVDRLKKQDGLPANTLGISALDRKSQFIARREVLTTIAPSLLPNITPKGLDALSDLFSDGEPSAENTEIIEAARRTLWTLLNAARGIESMKDVVSTDEFKLLYALSSPDPVIPDTLAGLSKNPNVKELLHSRRPSDTALKGMWELIAGFKREHMARRTRR